MDLTHLHLVLNHFPIIGTLIGTMFLLYGVIIKNDSIKNIAIGCIVTMAIIAIPVFLTGEPAEESVEHIPGISETVIEAHEEAAELAFWVMEITGIIGLISLIATKLNKNIGQFLILITLAASMVSFSLMARTGYLGGKIRHTELAGNTANAPAGTGENAEGDDD